MWQATVGFDSIVVATVTFSDFKEFKDEKLHTSNNLLKMFRLLVWVYFHGMYVFSFCGTNEDKATRWESYGRAVAILRTTLAAITIIN